MRGGSSDISSIRRSELEGGRTCRLNTQSVERVVYETKPTEARGIKTDRAERPVAVAGANPESV